MLREKSEAFDQAHILFKKIQNEQDYLIKRIRSDHGREFENSIFEDFCAQHGIQQEFSFPINPQQNGMVEQKNQVIQEMTRVMIHAKNMAQHFWGEVVNTACHIINRVFLRPATTKTPYELWRGRKPTVKYFRVFRSTCYILCDRENLGKFDAKSDVGIFLGFSTISRASRMYNSRTKTVMKSINVVIDDETTIEHLKDEVPHVEGEQVGFPNTIHAPPIPNMSTVSFQHYHHMQKMKPWLGLLFVTGYPTCHHPELNSIILEKICWEMSVKVYNYKTRWLIKSLIHVIFLSLSQRKLMRH